MTKDKTILIQNIYHMLSYAFRILQQNNYQKIAGETFEQIHDLLAAILARGMAQLSKQGLYREYVECNETLSTLKGKLDLPGTIRHRVQRKQVLACQFDEFSENNILNQILKTTAQQLVQMPEVNSTQKQELKKVLLHFGNVDTIQPRNIRWNQLQFQRNNQTYRMLIYLCYFIWHELLLTTDSGKYRMMEFSDNNMAKLFERFVREYYRKHYDDCLSPSARQVEWNFTEPIDDEVKRFLPAMNTDTTLHDPISNHTLIIDTKYLGSILQTGQFGNKTFSSDNLYQIFAYVKNQDKSNTGNVSGMLLYAKTTEEDVPDNTSFVIGNNHFCVHTLDLNQSFEQIQSQLDDIVKSYFGAITKQ